MPGDQGWPNRSDFKQAKCLDAAARRLPFHTDRGDVCNPCAGAYPKQTCERMPSEWWASAVGLS